MRSRRSSGFSVLELLLVLVILGILWGGVGVRWLDWFGRERLGGVAARLEGLLSYGLSQALLGGGRWEVLYDLEGQRVWVGLGGGVVEGGWRPGYFREFFLPEGVRIRDIEVFRGKYEGGEVRFEISELGVLASHIVHLEAEGGKGLSLVFSSLTGTLRLEEGYREYEVLEDVEF